MQTVATTRKWSSTSKRILEFAVLTVIMGSLTIAIGSSPSLIPDLIYRWVADPESEMKFFGVIFVIDAIVIFCFMKGKTFNGTFSMLTTTVVLAVSIYAIIAMSAARDLDGSGNPYVRAEEATARQYQQLTAAKRYPQVAEQIGRATADGIVTKGEAYDILNGEVLRESVRTAAQIDAEKTRDSVLSVR